MELFIDKIEPSLKTCTGQVQPGRSLGEKSAADQSDLARLEEIKESCAEIESLFLSLLFKTMRRTVPKDGLFQSSFGQDVFDTMFDQQVSILLSRSGGIGLGQIVFNQMVEQKELEQLDKQNINLKALPYKRIIPAGLAGSVYAVTNGASPNRAAAGLRRPSSQGSEPSSRPSARNEGLTF